MTFADSIGASAQLESVHLGICPVALSNSLLLLDWKQPVADTLPNTAQTALKLGWLSQR